MQLKLPMPSIWLGLIKNQILDFMSKHGHYALFLKTKNERSMKLIAFFTPINFSNSFCSSCTQWFKFDGLAVIFAPTQASVKNGKIVKMGVGGCGLQWDNSVIAYYLTTYFLKKKKSLWH